MICEKCRQSNPDENNFCGNCGASMPKNGRFTLKDLLDAGLLKPGDELTINVRGKDVTATLTADGKMKYQDGVYDGPLACASAIRGQTCDSWYCWKALDRATGRSYGIGHYRSALLKKIKESR